MTQTVHPAGAPPARGEHRPPHARVVTGLAAVICVLAAVAASAGILARARPTGFLTARGEAVELFGDGIYRFDSLLAGAGNRGTDWITLLVVIPVLVAAVLGYRTASLRWGLIITGLFGSLLYVYATMAVGTALNSFFLVYVVLFAACLWALVLTMRDVDLPAIELRIDRLPRRGPAALMITSGVATALIWVAPVLQAQLSGGTPAGLGVYATSVTTALDMAVITPAACIAGLLILRGSAFGYLLAFPLLVLEALLAPMIIAQTISQRSAGVTLTAAEIAGPVSGFLLLSLVAIWMVVRLLGALGPTHHE